MCLYEQEFSYSPQPRPGRKQPGTTPMAQIPRIDRARTKYRALDSLQVFKAPADCFASPSLPQVSSSKKIRIRENNHLTSFQAIMSTTQPETPVDLVLSLLLSLLITLAAFPLGILAACAHVLATLIRSIPTFIGLAIGCVVLTCAVLLASAGYVVFSGLVGCKKVARVGTNMASVFLDELTKEKARS